MTSTKLVDLEQFDSDGALAETGGELDAQTRGAFLRRAGIGAAGLAGAGALLGGGLPSMALGATPKHDVKILNYALTLEYLEAEFYAQAKQHITSGPLGAFATLVASDEAAHVAALKKVLGRKAVAKPTFDFGNAVTDPDTFQATAFTLENTGVGAYLGQAGKIKTPAILAAAASILTVEARHAGAIATIINTNQLSGPKGIVPNGPFDKPLSMKTVLTAVKKTGFIKG
jgi:rubrerythrin